MADAAYPDRSGKNNANFRGGFEKPCDQCGTLRWVTPSKAERHKRHFCASECRNKWLAENTTGEKGSKWAGGKIGRACAVCGTVRYLKPAEVKRGEGRTCSRACFYISQRKEMTPERLARKKLDSHMCVLIGRSLKNGGKRRRRWETLVGYSAADLIAHLEAQFAGGMGWHNTGEWHIDHIVPRASFSYTTAEDPEFKRCWSLSNLQPLWALDNARKGSRLDWQPESRGVGT